MGLLRISGELYMRFSPQESTKTETNYHKLRTQGFNHAFSRTNQRSDRLAIEPQILALCTTIPTEANKKAEKPNPPARWTDGTRCIKTANTEAPRNKSVYAANGSNCSYTKEAARKDFNEKEETKSSNDDCTNDGGPQARRALSQSQRSSLSTSNSTPARASDRQAPLFPLGHATE